MINRRALLQTLLAVPTAATLARCTRSAASQDANVNPRAARGEPLSSGGSATQLPRWPSPRARASSAFSQRWGDGRAELIGYEAVSPRYGHLRPAELVLVYVTEPFSRRTLIKDDSAQGDDRMDMLKVNVSEKFQTGIYPYSLLTSVFCPSDVYGRERFSPAKITLSAQEWCGHVFAGVWPDQDAFLQRAMSYFASEGEVDQRVSAPSDVLYEDALLVQLRELDGPFANGSNWQGHVVPALWRNRRAHQTLVPDPARITRSQPSAEITRFRLETGQFWREFDVESSGEKRIAAMRSSDGGRARLLRSARLPYWQLNSPGDESHRADLGLSPLPQQVIAPDGTVRVGF
ncbi:MAG: hypothetical protein Q8Q09_04165 [Deltaproteobacteria bacterium]|nr:hypothetical protein [Deltaproteobacteria bacterium]